MNSELVVRGRLARWSGSLGARRVFVALLVAVACHGARSTDPEPVRLAPSLTLITADELSRVQAVNVYEAVEKLRPEMLRGRGRTTFRTNVSPTPVVYLDDHRFGEIEEMKQLPLSGVLLIRYINASDAHVRFGPNNTAGVIQIVTARQPLQAAPAGPVRF
jgi:hypothetical protein